MAVAIATTRSDGESSSMATVGGGNSNSAVGTADVGSAAPPSPKVTPGAPAESNFAFVAPNSGVGGGSAFERCPGVSGSGKSGKSGSFCYSSGKSGKSGGHGLINLSGSSWYGSGKSGKSNSFPSLPTCAKPSGKSGKSGYTNQLWNREVDTVLYHPRINRTMNVHVSLIVLKIQMLDAGYNPI